MPAYWQYTKLFELDGVGLEFTDDAVNAIADKRPQYENDEEHDRAISEQILGDAIIMREEAYECAQMVMDHTPEEKQEFLEYCWKYVSRATNRINRMTKIFKPSDVEQ